MGLLLTEVRWMLTVRNVLRRLTQITASVILIVYAGVLGLAPASAISSPDGYFDTQTKYPQPLLIVTTQVEADGRTSQSRCSGVLVHKYHVATAAHCISPALQHKTEVIYLDFSVKKVKMVVIKADYWSVHPRYNEETDQNDLAVVVLTKPITKLPVVKLPKQGDTVLSGFRNLIALGWGENQNGYLYNLPTFAKVDDYSSQLSEEDWFNPATTIAAGKWRADERIFTGACAGDSGGPLLAKFGSNTFLVGISSLGNEDCTESSPSIFTKVSAYTSWVQAHWARRK